MKETTYHRLRKGATVFIGAIVGVAVAQQNLLLALFGFIAGMLFLFAIKSKARVARVATDERQTLIGDKAARLTYVFFAVTVGFAGTIMSILSPTLSSPIAPILSYLILYLMLLYSIFYFYLNQKYGGNSHDK